jgi:hypothetical protein
LQTTLSSLPPGCLRALYCKAAQTVLRRYLDMVEPHNFTIVSINAVVYDRSLNVQIVRLQNGRVTTNAAPQVSDNLAISQLSILGSRQLSCRPVIAHVQAGHQEKK